MKTPMYLLTLHPGADSGEILSLTELRQRLPELHTTFSNERTARFLDTLQNQGFVDDPVSGVSAVWHSDTPDDVSLSV